MSMREINIAATAINMFDGMRLSGDRERFDHIVGECWGQGFLELTLLLGEYAVLSEDTLEQGFVKDFPGVYDYEVSYFFGDWFAKYLDTHGRQPPDHECRDKLLTLIKEFFEQGHQDAQGT